MLFFSFVYVVEFYIYKNFEIFTCAKEQKKKIYFIRMPRAAKSRDHSWALHEYRIGVHVPRLAVILHRTNWPSTTETSDATFYNKCCKNFIWKCERILKWHNLSYYDIWQQDRQSFHVAHGTPIEDSRRSNATKTGIRKVVFNLCLAPLQENSETT